MENFELSAFLTISGIGAASGMVFKDNQLYIISDNSGFLYQYNLTLNKLYKHPLVPNATENTRKKLKSDFESITLNGNNLHIFGSGSTANRNQEIIFNIQNQSIQEKDATFLYQNIKETVPIADCDLNIEGAFYYQDYLYLFQRGNGGNSKNGIIKINSSDYINDNFNSKIQFQSVQLPKISKIEATFTDAILIEDKVYFLAAAEDTDSTYFDGEVLGSLVGRMDLETMTVDFTIKISDNIKFEGITLFKKTNQSLTFLLCEDNDTENLESIIYELKLNL